MLRIGESNPGHLRDRQRCYQLHQFGQVASNEDRTRDLALTKRMLCQLSYRGGEMAGLPRVGPARAARAGLRRANQAFVIRSYQGERTASHQNCEVKHPWA